MAIKNIIFDLDNTLVYADLAYEKALNAIGLSTSDTEYLEARKFIKNRLPTGHVVSRNRLHYIKRILEVRGEFSATQALKLMETYEKVLFSEMRDQVKKLKRAQFFAKLKKKKFRMAILTNENLRTQLVKLKAIDPQNEFFTHMLVSEEVGYEKPDPRLYHEIFRHTKFKLEETIMVGDDIDADINGAKAVGLKTVLVCEFSKVPVNKPESADYVIKTLEDLLEIL